MAVLPLAVLLLFVALSAAGGCSADDPLNPAFPLRYAEAREALNQMEQNPQLPIRPVVVACGIHDPGFFGAQLARGLQNALHPETTVIHVAFFGANSFDDCAKRLIDAVEEAFPSEDDCVTTEVDVVGFSMGGLVARHAARTRETVDDGCCSAAAQRPRLRIARLFTIGTPHQGANWAHVPTFDERTRDMRFQSDFLHELDVALDDAPYELYCYVRLGDTIVGVENAAPPGMPVLWVANKPFSPAHIGASNDARLLADIARRLRGEPAYARFTDAAPPPNSEARAAGECPSNLPNAEAAGYSDSR